MSYDPELEPTDALWQAIESTRLSMVTADDLVGGAEARLGRPINGHQRVDLLSLAQGELDYYKDTDKGETYGGSN